MKGYTTLDEFITQRRNEKTNRRFFINESAWVNEPKFEGLYVRYGSRAILGYQSGFQPIYNDVLDIANVEVEERYQRTGVFTALVVRLRETYPGMHLYVENVLNPEFRPLLFRLGFSEVLHDSFFLEGEST